MQNGLYFYDKIVQLCYKRQKYKNNIISINFGSMPTTLTMHIPLPQYHHDLLQMSRVKKQLHFDDEIDDNNMNQNIDNTIQMMKHDLLSKILRFGLDIKGQMTTFLSQNGQ